MSILGRFKCGWLISHEDYVNSFYTNVQYVETEKCFTINKGLFNISTPYKKHKGKITSGNHKRHHSQTEQFSNLITQCNLIQTEFIAVRNEIEKYLGTDSVTECNGNPLEVACHIYDRSSQNTLQNLIGTNTDSAKYVTINSQNYIVPENCKFYCKDVAEIESYLIEVKYDLIVLDPPWWNKYIRRKKAKTNHGYSMMYNSDLKAIPVENLLNEDGIVVVWCTNSTQNLNDLKDIFIKWKVHLAANWFWLKVTMKGETICNFSEPPGKQPFEQIIIGVRNIKLIDQIPDDKIIFSIPSALHSHKLPLLELFRDYLPATPQCLELFARYLLPNWTSWGLEAIRFQHESLYDIKK